jgi:hypothetical protein
MRKSRAITNQTRYVLHHFYKFVHQKKIYKLFIITPLKDLLTANRIK